MCEHCNLVADFCPILLDIKPSYLWNEHTPAFTRLVFFFFNVDHNALVGNFKWL